mmetsp:Transcript_9325/g.17853  ORF Transcript_9325/g.17853 Transcript_9325/m.17853 type:complete len:866 (+) Transcript_9325:1364-3961(+)
MSKAVIINEDLFLTQDKDNLTNFHPSMLDEHLEEFLKARSKATALKRTGIVKVSELDSMAEFKQLSTNFDQLDREIINSHNLKAKEAVMEQTMKNRLRRELRKQEKEELFQHRNSKIMEKLTVKEPSPGYYEDKPIKPGFDFFNCLMRCPRKEFTKLSLNIPNSLYFKDKIFHLWTGPEGLLQYSDDISYYGFFKQIFASNKKTGHPFDKVAAVLRMRGESYTDTRKQVLDYTTFETKMNNHDLNPMSMIQQFIRCPGGRPAVIRLYYHTYGSNGKANYAYFINSLGLEIASNSQTEELSKCVVNTTKPEQLEVFKQAGIGLKPYEAEAAKIVAFLNTGYNLRISEMVLDFIKDERGLIWFSSCKRIIYDDVSLATALKPKKMPWEDITIEDDEEISTDAKKDRFKSCVRCKLCRLVYPNFELENLVSLHMLITYKQHAIKRVDLPWDTSHLKFATKDQLSQCVRVCQYCYLLLTTELDLMETERALALMMSIPCKEQTLTEDPMLGIQLQFLPKQLMQWRYLCFLEKFSSPSVLPGRGLYLIMKCNDTLTTYPIDNFNEPLNCMKVNYIYHQQQRSPKQFFASFVAEVRLTQGTEWKHWLAKCSIPLLKDFPDDLQFNQALIQSTHTVLFNRRHEPVVTLSLKAGVSSDYPVNSSNIKSMMTKQAEIYIPDPSHTTTDPLPIAWMELFGMFEEELSLDDAAEKEIYVPSLTHAEMLRMEDITSPMKKLKRYPIDPNKHFHRCCSDNTRSASASRLRSRSKTPLRAVQLVPNLELKEMLDSTAVEVKKLHSQVGDFLQKRPSTSAANSRSVSVLKRLPTDRLEGASTQRSSRVATETSSRVTPNRRRDTFNRRMEVIRKYVTYEP